MCECGSGASNPNEKLIKREREKEKKLGENNKISFHQYSLQTMSQQINQNTKTYNHKQTLDMFSLLMKICLQP